MQRVLVGEADGPVNLMSNRRRQGGGLAGADFGHGHIERQTAAVVGFGLQHFAGAAQGNLGRHARGADGSGHLRQLLLDRLEFADGLAELGAFIGITDGLVQARLQRTDQRTGTDQRTEHPDRLLHVSQLKVANGVDGSMGEVQGVALFAGKITTGLQADGGLTQVHQRHLSSTIGDRGPATAAGPRHIECAAVEMAIRVQDQLAKATDLDQRDGLFGNLQAGTGQQQRGEHGFAQRQWRAPVTNGAQYRADFQPTGGAAPGFFGHQGAGQALLDHLLPQRCRGVTGIETGQHLRRDLFGEQPLDAVGDDRLQLRWSTVVQRLIVGGLVHRSPNPLAMMPRRISRVPPRRENDGAVWVR
ncbi:hypothetical protein D3C81_1103870 [compost metagenome]